MALPQKESTPIFSDATAGTLRLIAYLALAAVLMVLDHRNGWLHRARYVTAAAIVPIYKIAAAPADWVHRAGTAFAQRGKLIDENRQLRNNRFSPGENSDFEHESKNKKSHSITNDVISQERSSDDTRSVLPARNLDRDEQRSECENDEGKRQRNDRLSQRSRAVQSKVKAGPRDA